MSQPIDKNNLKQEKLETQESSVVREQATENHSFEGGTEKPTEKPGDDIARVAQEIEEISVSAEKLKKTSTSQYQLSDEEEKEIKQAIEIAFAKGIEKGVDYVRTSDSPHLVDAFHDRLVDQLYDRLLQSGKLKKEN